MARPRGIVPALVAVGLLLLALAVPTDGPADAPADAPVEVGHDASVAAVQLGASVPGTSLGGPIEAARAVEGGAPGAGPEQSGFNPLALIGASRWQSVGFTGHQVRVAILDTGFAGYRSALGVTLPRTVVARSFRADGNVNAGTDHGLRAAEIVHSVAPNADLYLVNFSSLSDLSRAVDYLIAEDVDIVSFSVGFIHDGPGDGTGDVNAIVDRATTAGIAWAVAAGNWAEQHWGGFFRDLDGDSVHEFPLGQTLTHEFVAGDLVIASLRWDDEFGASCSDYDLELFGPSGALIAASRDIQNCASDPVEGIRVLATQSGLYALRVLRAEDDRPRRISLMLIGSPDRGGPTDQRVATGSLSQPADHPRVVTVGALGDIGISEAPYSSRGPTLDRRVKPDVLAPTAREGVRFAGTSSAAPHAAGALALLREAFPAASRAQLTSQLVNRSILLPPAPGQTPGVRLMNLGSPFGLGLLLPSGADRATVLGLPAEAGVAIGFYQGPDGYPVRFLHLLADGREATSVFRVRLPERVLERYIPGAPGFVNEFETFDGGDLLFLRFDE